MAAFETADGSEHCNAPGLGTIRVKHLRSGLTRGVLKQTDLGFVFARIKGHFVCKECADRKHSICDHCRCTGCIWQNEAEEKGGPRASKAQVDALRERLRTFQIGRQAPKTEVEF